MSDLKINKGNPTEPGTYVAYTEHRYVTNFPEKQLLMFIGGKWGHLGSDQFYRGKVYGWIGPLPSPTLDFFNTIGVKYAIGIYPDVIHGAIGLQNGPFDNLDEALYIIGNSGEYIFELHLDQEAVAIRKWSEKRMKWLKKKK